jgi:ribonucleoside-triphosphate reductase
MRNLEVIESELASAREALSSVKGTPAEVYSRIVGYYRSVRNWNRGKREEYGERVMFTPDASLLASCAASPDRAYDPAGAIPPACTGEPEGSRVLLFVRSTCPACPAAKTAAGRLGVPLELYDAGTEEGLAEAARRNVLSTPTAILLSADGEELGRARDPDSIGRLPVPHIMDEPVAV